MPEEIKEAPTNGQATQTPAPATGQAGQALKSDQVQDQLPEKFKGKSAEEIAKSYIELEKKLGDNSKEVNATRQELEQWKVLGQVINSDPTLYKLIEDKVTHINNTKPDQPKRDDTRVAVINQTINGFEQKYGLDQLQGERKAEVQARIGKEMAEMLDPKGTKSVAQIIESIPADRLPIYLEKAYRLATIGDREETARIKGLMEANQNSQAAFGNSQSSGVKEDKVSLTPDEQKVARKLKITEEQYVKQKQTLQE